MANNPFMTPIMKDEINREALVEWRKELEDDRGARARLRRCREPSQVLLLSSYYRLKASMADPEKNSYLALAVVAGLLANASYEDGVFFSGSFAGQLGTPKTKDGPPLMSKSRFRQLIKSRDWSEFYRRMRRAIRMIKGSANILSIADFVFQYDYEQRREFDPEPSRRFQFRFAQDYFEASLKKGKKEAP